MRKVWWVNMMCLAVFSVGIIGIERVMPFMPRAIAAEPPAFQFVPIDDTSETTPETTPDIEKTNTEERGPAEVPQIPEPLNFGGFGDGLPEISDPLPVLGRDKGDGPKRVHLQQGGGGGMGGQKGKAKPEEFIGRGKRGKQGYVPQPDIMDMPRALQDELPRGWVSMKLGFRVSAEGKIVEIHVDRSSGNVLLDRFMMEWYRRKGTFVGGAGERVFVETLTLQLPE